jgi:hypothetical protein
MKVGRPISKDEFIYQMVLFKIGKDFPEGHS